VHTTQLERIAIDLRSTSDGDATRYRGYLVDGEILRELPVGSTLNTETGEFAWAPGLAFGGAHDLVFVRTLGHEAGAHEEQIRVRVTIDTESAKSGEARLVIDIPRWGEVVDGPFTIAGWAIDPSAPMDGAGIDTLHVWAYPLGGGGSGFGIRSVPIWIGVASHGGLRPDVASAYGDRFAQSGYGIDAAGLPAGTYDIVVYAHSVATNSFTIARTVRVTVR
jgi:hypothetical protein